MEKGEYKGRREIKKKEKTRFSKIFQTSRGFQGCHFVKKHLHVT